MHTFQFINKFLHRHPIEPINKEEEEQEQEEQDIKIKKVKKMNSWKQMFLFDDDTTTTTTNDIHIQKYLHDPMRNTNIPDRLGEFYDPMAVYHHGQLATMPYDVTNTGA